MVREHWENAKSKWSHISTFQNREIRCSKNITFYSIIIRIIIIIIIIDLYSAVMLRYYL